MGTIGREAVDWGILITVVCGSETLGGGVQWMVVLCGMGGRLVKQLGWMTAVILGVCSS